MLEVYDRSLRRVAVLENAMDRVEVERLNGVGRFSFSLPGDDEKAESVEPFGFIRNGTGAYYRILSAQRRDDAEEALWSFEAEHAVATLVDNIMFQTHILGGPRMSTRDVLAYILERQSIRRWVLGDCDIIRYYEYAFESENLLSALFAVPKLFSQPYRWAFDMRAQPWTLSLKAMDGAGAPAFCLEAGRNLLGTESGASCVDVCTRLYPLGYGEGTNQLTIAGVNGGVPYLESPPAYTEKYGRVSKVFVDRSIEDAQSLMERARVLLGTLQEPRLTRSIKAVDLYPLTGEDMDKAQAGDVCLLRGDGTRAFVTGVTRMHDEPGKMEIELSTVPEDIGEDMADLADRQRVEQVHAQGATQVYMQSAQANADPENAAELRFFIPGDMRVLNKVSVRIALERYRGEQVDAQGQTARILRLGNPTGARVYLGDRECFTVGKDAQRELTPFLLDTDGRVTRDAWLRIGVMPNDLAWVSIHVMVQGFVQSRGGGVY